MAAIEKSIVHTSVFANSPEGGNPCPVVLDGDDLTAEQGKSLAARFGAETILVVQPRTPGADFGLRYFVPLHEMGMCIHGTIAAITLLKSRGRFSRSPVKIDTVLGQITANWEEDKMGTLNVTVFQFPPKFAKSNPSAEEVSSALRIPMKAIRHDLGAIVSVSTSRYKLIVPLTNDNILNGLEPDYELLWRICDQFDTTGFYPFAASGSSDSVIYTARQFPRRVGYNEDPATGVASCALGSYLATQGGCKEGWSYFQILQGYAMGRPSRLEAGAYVQDGRVTKTCVSGKASIHNECLESVPTAI